MFKQFKRSPGTFCSGDLGLCADTLLVCVVAGDRVGRDPGRTLQPHLRVRAPQGERQASCVAADHLATSGIPIRDDAFLFQCRSRVARVNPSHARAVALWMHALSLQTIRPIWYAYVQSRVSTLLILRVWLKGRAATINSKLDWCPPVAVRVTPFGPDTCTDMHLLPRLIDFPRPQ